MYRAQAEWDKSGKKYKELLFVEFPNCISTSTKKPFKWLPTHEQLKKIKEELDEIEKIWAERGLTK